MTQGHQIWLQQNKTGISLKLALPIVMHIIRQNFTLGCKRISDFSCTTLAAYVLPVAVGMYQTAEFRHVWLTGFSQLIGRVASFCSAAARFPSLKVPKSFLKWPLELFIRYSRNTCKYYEHFYYKIEIFLSII